MYEAIVYLIPLIVMCAFSLLIFILIIIADWIDEFIDKRLKKRRRELIEKYKAENNLTPKA